MKKLISLVLIMSLLITSQPSQANFFTDLFGGLFTIVSYPIQLILGSTKSPFFASQNPFVEKEWHKEERKKVIHIINEIPEAKPLAETPTPTPKLRTLEEEILMQKEKLRAMPIDQREQAAMAWNIFFAGNVQQ
jgi:hypothetical protein